MRAIAWHYMKSLFNIFHGSLKKNKLCKKESSWFWEQEPIQQNLKCSYKCWRNQQHWVPPIDALELQVSIECANVYMIQNFTCNKNRLTSPLKAFDVELWRTRLGHPGWSIYRQSLVNMMFNNFTLYFYTFVNMFTNHECKSLESNVIVLRYKEYFT